MENADSAVKKKWYSIREAAEYLDVGEPTLYRWMREGKITYRKVGDSTRFWQEDLDSVMQVYHSEKDLDKTREVCPVCRHPELVEGKVRGAGLVYFVPKKTKFWTFKDSFVDTDARMCTRCGSISWFGDTAKLAKLRAEAPESDTPGNTPDAEQK
ncbi:MAG TPA: helix-turn-helix domain-containing protein [Verrucomicrobiae bacterium]|nr:helix-turn-helix domain-containing protein [Verrucomicrobiae bacterium]